ncbi:MAG TPA: hypothetical protein VLD19_20985 [Chitinophagaceae bacterium]|nr:hypothetical protein [Chitinophagaceae bacterium]
MKKLLSLVLVAMATGGSYAQTKVFKEVNDEISTQIRMIRQDDALVGYLAFTQLEKASADSFNYKITIMDENLNDIGTVNFREQQLNLQAVSFEQDVLCLAYLKSNVIGREFDNIKEYKASFRESNSYIFTQFLGLNGKIIKSNSIEADITMSPEPFSRGKKVMGKGKLKEDIQLRNIPQKGYALFYGDDSKKSLIIYNPAGKKTWEMPIGDDAQAYILLTSGQDVYILLKKKNDMLEGGYELLSYGTKDSSTYTKLKLKDRRGSALKVLAFDNDPVTGKPFLSGNIISPGRGNDFLSPRQIAKGTYTGVFTINVNGHEKSEINEVYTYWEDCDNSFVNKKGYLTSQQAYARLERSFKDYEGNTYFTGSSFIKRPKWGSITAAVVTAPLLFPPIYILAGGTSKAKVKDAVLLKQNIKGGLSLDNSIEGNTGKFFTASYAMYAKDLRSYYTVANSDTKTNYLILDDTKDIFIYNVNQKKVVRTIAHKDGNIRTYVFPAKEGHVMVSEYNKKEKYTRYSIEAL